MAEQDTIEAPEQPRNLKTRTPMSEDHKQALAEGRERGKAVKAYLEALENHKPRRGRQVTPEQLQERLVEVNTKLDAGESDPTTRVALIQERLDLENRIQQATDTFDLDALEQEFIKNVKPWAEGRTQKISYAALREVGVPPKVLKAAGLDRKAS